MHALRKWLLSGLLVIVPLVITLGVLNWIIGTLDQTLWLLPTEWTDWLNAHRVRGLGVLLTLAILLLVGAVASNFVGKRLLGWGDALVRRIPVVRSIYSSVKQVSDTLLSPSGQAFRKPVLVEFPRAGSWSVGFVVGSPGLALQRPLDGEHASVYVPTAPNPTSGYVLIVPVEQIVDLDVTVDEALKFVVSMGVVAPGSRTAATDAALPASVRVRRPVP